jgi:hypothetical protein
MNMNDLRIKLERAIVTLLVNTLARAGFVPVLTDDGGERVPTPNLAAVLETVFSVDESRVWFANESVSPGTRFGVFLVGGNGSDIISDYSCGGPEFVAAMEMVHNAIDILEVK